LNRNESGRFGALKSDSTHHFFRNACAKSGSLRFSQFSGCWLILSFYSVNVPVVFRMKIKISKSSISLLTSEIICLNLLKNKIFKIEIWSLAFRNACTKSGSLRFSQFSGCWQILSVYIIMSLDFPFVRLFGVR
jgi:hypothetical protein